MREQRIQAAIDNFKESTKVLPRKLEQFRRQQLMACGKTAGQVDKLERGVDEVEYDFTYSVGMQPVQKRNRNQTPSNQGRILSREITMKLHKSDNPLNDYRHLLKMLLNTGRTMEHVAKLNGWTVPELQKYLDNEL